MSRLAKVDKRSSHQQSGGKQCTVRIYRNKLNMYRLFVNETYVRQDNPNVGMPRNETIMVPRSQTTVRDAKAQRLFMKMTITASDSGVAARACAAAS